MSTSRLFLDLPGHESFNSTYEGDSDCVRPYLKWPGGKRWLAPWLVDCLISELKGEYYEPFLGGAAVFLHLNPSSAVLSDINSDLIESIDTIRKYPSQVVHAAWRFSNTRTCYERVRRSIPRSAIGAAARFLYLNRTCWGGIYRLNRKGEFNTPFGNSGRVICRKSDVLHASSRFNRAILKSSDFEDVLTACGEGDVAYLDPPYATSGIGECFVRYNSQPFAWNDHLRLAGAALRASSRGAFIALSAFWRDEFVSMYPGWWVGQVLRHSNVSQVPAKRRKISEVVMFNRIPKSFANQIGEKIVMLRRVESADQSGLPIFLVA